MNVRMTRPPGTYSPTTVNGIAYQCAAGDTIDVPDFIAAGLTEGWISLGLVGTTAERPVPGGGVFLDTTLDAVIKWAAPTPMMQSAGIVGRWVNVLTGAQV